MFERTFKPTWIGPVTVPNLPNRVVRTSHITLMGDEGGTDRLIAYHLEREKGGVGVIFQQLWHGGGHFPNPLGSPARDGHLPTAPSEHHAHGVSCRWKPSQHALGIGSRRDASHER